MNVYSTSSYNCVYAEKDSSDRRHLLNRQFLSSGSFVETSTRNFETTPTITYYSVFLQIFYIRPVLCTV